MKQLLRILLWMLPFGRVLNQPIIQAGGKVVPITPTDIVLGSLVIAYLRSCRRAEKQPLRESPLARPLWQFIAWCVISLLFGAWTFHLSIAELGFSTLYLVRWVEYAVVFFVVLEVGREDPDCILRDIIYGGVAFAAFGIFQAVFLPDFALVLNPAARPYIDYDPQGHRLVSTFLDPNIAAGYLVYCALIAGSMYLAGARQLLAAFSVLCLAVLLTLSRGGIVAFFCGAVVLMFLRKLVDRRVLAIVAIGVIVSAVLYPVLAPYLDELQRIRVDDDSAMMRIQDWLVAFNMIVDHPLMGIGFNSFGFVSWRYGLEREGGMAFGFPGDLLLILTLTGGVGLILYLRLYVAVARRVRMLVASPRASRDFAIGAGVVAATVGAVVSSCFTTVILYPQIMALMWTSWALLFARGSAAPMSPATPVVSRWPTLFQLAMKAIQEGAQPHS